MDQNRDINLLVGGSGVWRFTDSCVQALKSQTVESQSVEHESNWRFNHESKF